MIDPDAIRLLNAAVSPEEPAGTPPYPKDPEVQQQGLMQYLIYWAARHEYDAVTRVDTSRFMLAMGRFTRAIMLERRYPLFAGAGMRMEGFQEMLRGAAAEAQSVGLSFLTYFNFDDIMEKKQGDPAAVAEMQRRGAMSAGGLS